MSKQDRTQSRTPVDTERKYLLTLEKSFAEIVGIATDARKYAEKTGEDLSAEIARLDVKIQETADGIILSVEDVYATNESVASAIEVMKGDILLSVSETYETQENANAKRAEMQVMIDEQGASIENQAKLIDENKQNLASLQVKVDENSASIESQAELISENKSSIASTNTKVDENTASIQAQAATITEHTTNIASLEAKTDEQGASIGLIVNEDGVMGSVVVEAINGQSSAKISADKLDIEGKELNIKVKSTNIEGELTADQINADGLEVTEGKIGGWTLGEAVIPTSYNDDHTVAESVTKMALMSAAQSSYVDGTAYTNTVWLTADSVYGVYYTDGMPKPIAIQKSWLEILLA